MVQEILPGGAISEIFGMASCGKTALLHGWLADATTQGECCALIDAKNAFDPLSASEMGVNLRHVLWVRGNGAAAGVRVDHAMKAVDLLIQGGGFGIVMLDLTDVDPPALNRIPTSYWYRFRLALQNTPTRLVVAGNVPVVRSCASLQLEVRRERVSMRGPVFVGIESISQKRKTRAASATITGMRFVG